MPTPEEDFDGCNSECRRAGTHTLRWGGCEHAPEPEPTVSMSVVYQDHDGQNSIGFDTYTVPQLADLIADAFVTPQPGSLLIPMDRAWANGIALHAAKAIVHRNDANNAEQSPRTTPDNSPTSSDTPDNSLRDQLQAAIESEVYEFRERTMWWPEGEIAKEIARLATRGAMEIRDRELEQLRAKVAEFDHIINWHTTCASCARILDSSYQETVRAEQAERQRDQLAALVRDFRDPDPCRLDHHGYCQAHSWLCGGSRCPHARAREVLAELDSGPTIDECRRDDLRCPLERDGE